MRESQKYVAKSKSDDKDRRLQSLTDRISVSEQFVQARQLIGSNPTEALKMCDTLLRQIPAESQVGGAGEQGWGGGGGAHGVGEDGGLGGLVGALGWGRCGRVRIGLGDGDVGCLAAVEARGIVGRRPGRSPWRVAKGPLGVDMTCR